MKSETQKMLIMYLVALKNEGFTRIHVSEIIPNGSNKEINKVGRNWSVFVTFDQDMMELLKSNGIEYQKINGWFSL